MAHCWVFLFSSFFVSPLTSLQSSPLPSPHALPSLRPTLVGRIIFPPPLTPQEGIPYYPFILKIRRKEHSYPLPLLWAANKTEQKNRHRHQGFLCMDPVPKQCLGIRAQRWLSLHFLHGGKGLAPTRTLVSLRPTSPT